MKPVPLKISAKSRKNRWFAYSCLAVISGIAGIAIAWTSFKEYRATGGGEWQLLTILGVLLPFIMVIGEVIRFRRYCSKIAGAMCVDCRQEFDLKQLVKAGNCPGCGSRRVVGLVSDEEDPVVTLY